MGILHQMISGVFYASPGCGVQVEWFDCMYKYVVTVLKVQV